MPRTTVRPRKNGNPQSKPTFGSALPPICANTALPRAGRTTSASKLPIWNETAEETPGYPGEGAFVAEKLSRAGGQYQPGKSTQDGMATGDAKKSPFDPVSTNEPPLDVPPAIVVVNSPRRSSASALAGDGTLFARVPMPRTTEPSTAGAPAPGTAGKVTMMPLLSAGRSATGFCTCEDESTATPAGADPFHAK